MIWKKLILRKKLSEKKQMLQKHSLDIMTKIMKIKFVRDHCHSKGKLRGLAQKLYPLNTRQAHTSFVLAIFRKFLGYN